MSAKAPPIRLEREFDGAELDAFLATARGACFYHGNTWLRSLADIYGYRLGWLAAREGGRLLGLLPFAESRRYGLVHRQSLPFGTYGGPALAPEADDALAGQLCERFLAGIGGAVQRLSLILPPGSEWADATLVTKGLRTQVLDLSPGWETIFADSFRKEKRRQARKALREGVVVARSFDERDVADYYPIYLEHARRWRLAEVTPARHLQRLVTDHEGVRFWVARHQGEVVGAHFNLHFRGDIIAWHGTASVAHRHLAPSVLLYAINLEQACADGELRFNFGGSDANDPLYDFKAAFGARPADYPLVRRAGALYRALGKLRGGDA